MEIIQGLDRLCRRFRNPVVTLGNFDGVHLGHQKILARVVSEASRISGESVVITFDPHPLKVLSPDTRLSLLTSFKEKMLHIERCGIEVVLCLAFAPAFSEISPSRFVEGVLVKTVDVRKIVIGYNYHFGKDKAGDVETLKSFGERYGFEVEIVQPLRVDQTVVSSSKIREFIRNGALEDASRLLGRDYAIVGEVIQGARRGRTLGFPTANVQISDALCPKLGVYAVDVWWRQRPFQGVANVGHNLTFPGDGRISLEVHILDFDEPIYGEEIRVGFKRRIRGEIRFDSALELVSQIRDDIEWARQHVFKDKPCPRLPEE
jgi:riboflavin kinase / FMN adenylyltransferase